MGFRDENVAVRAHVEQLEGELEDVRKELADAKSGVRPPERKRGASSAGPIVLAVAVVVLGGAYIAGRAFPALGAAWMLAGVVLMSVAMMMMVMSRLMIVVAPNELAVVSGRNHPQSDGTVVGYRLVRSGRVLLIPMLERVDFMDLTNHVIDLELGGAHASGGVSVTVNAVANVKVAAHEPRATQAVERFLGRGRAEIARVARESLEGSLRGVVASLTVEELRADSLRVAEVVLSEADDDMQRLGLELDTFKIRSVEPN